MRAIAVLLGLFGAVLGLACAVTVHYLPVRDVGWFAYTPLTGPESRYPSIRGGLDWLPALWVLPVVGLVLGLLVSVGLGLARWRLRRG